MESIRIVTCLREKIAEIGRILNWMEESGHAHPIDFDLMLNKTRELYELEIFFSTGMDKQTDTQPVMEDKPPIPKEILMPEKQPVAPPPVSQEVVAPPVTQEVILPPVEPEPEPQPVFREEFRQPAPPTPVAEPHSPIMNFLFPESNNSPEKPVAPVSNEGRLNDVLGKQKPLFDVASSITETPINDIWSALAINDRFLFMRELFDNDSEAFKATITLLNSLPSWDAAAKYISGHFNWDNNNPIVKDFQTVVRRRFL